MTNHSKSLQPLINLKPGKRAIVEEIRGRELMTRLSMLGIRIGDEVEVLQGGEGGPLIIRRDGNRVAVGMGMSGKIFVSEIE